MFLLSSICQWFQSGTPQEDYTVLFADVKPPDEAGHVLFDDNPRGANNMHILTTLLDYLNAGKSCPKCGSKDSALSQHRGIDYHICSECDNRWIPSSNLPDDFMGTTPVYRPKKERRIQRCKCYRSRRSRTLRRMAQKRL